MGKRKHGILHELGEGGVGADQHRGVVLVRVLWTPRPLVSKPEVQGPPVSQPILPGV